MCGKKFQETAKLGYILPILIKFYSEYGKRAQMAKENKGIDWKAVSHAFRAAYQLKSIFVDGDIIYPLEEAEHLKKIKLGELHYKDIGPELDDLIDEVEELSKISTLPNKVDVKYWNSWLEFIIKDKVICRSCYV